jgi:tetratricopeptide (TPR) repeat protein
MTQEQLATTSGTGLRTIRNIESGRIIRPRPSTVRLLADAFELHGGERDRFYRYAFLEGHQPAEVLHESQSVDGEGSAVTSPLLLSVHQPPRQLPADTAGFTGRGPELLELGRLLSQSGRPPAVVISAIAGTAGTGKTALAVHAAHRLADRYPDGQLFIDLHGFTPATTPVEPGETLDRLLRALGVPGERIPAGLDDRAGLWRSTLAGRRMLVLLDNAATEQQVAPLLPGTPGCLVLVTSRRRLAGLDATLPVSLDLLPAADAATLFVHSTGPERQVAAPGELLTDAVERCGRLPLAIRIAAARLRSHPSWHLADLVDRLRDEDQRLAELTDEDGPRSVATALAVSYQQLSADQQHLYRLLGCHPGPDIDQYATAALLDTTPARAERLLNRLLDAHLLQEPTPGRYALHDLVRAHAVTTVSRPLHGRGWSERHRQRRAVGRLLGYYRHTAAAAMDAAYPYERARRPAVPPAGTPTPDLADPAAATRWLDTELPNLLATARYAATNGWPAYTCQLAAILHRHLRTSGRYHDAEALHQQALTTARDTGDRTHELSALTGLGWIHLVLGRYPQARDCFDHGLAIARMVADRRGQLDALLGLGELDRIQGRYGAALDHLGPALAIARAVGDRSGELTALRGFGEVDLIQGRHQSAVDNLEQALAIAQATGNPHGELGALLVLGEAHRLQGRLEQALDGYRRAHQIARAAGNRYGELVAVRGLGHVHRMQGRHHLALASLEAALEIARTYGARHGELGTLLALGHLHRQQDRYAAAEDCYQQVLEAARELDDLNWQFEALHGLGRLHHAGGRPDLAATRHRQALELATRLGQPADQARAHDGLGHAHRALRRHQQARRHWQSALDILAELGTDYTEDEEASAPAIRAHLAGLDRS